MIILKIVIISGSYPPDACGVGDYSFCLVNSLKKKNINVEVFTTSNWGMFNFSKIKKEIHLLRPDIIHIQYPTIGYKKSLVPQLITLLKPSVVTLHEISQSHILRRLALCPFSLANNIIFTTSYEYEYACKWFPGIKNKSSVIPIGNNIPVRSVKTKDLTDIIYFGLIRPNKGLEKIIELAKLIKQKSLNYKIRIVGAVDYNKRDYYEKLYNDSVSLPIAWSLNLSSSEVAEILSRAKIAYLPFPDGASERRGSLIASLANGIVVITTFGTQTPFELKDIVEFTNEPENVLETIQKLLSDENYYKQLAQKGRIYTQKFSWENIAEQHIYIYTKILNTK